MSAAVIIKVMMLLMSLCLTGCLLACQMMEGSEYAFVLVSNTDAASEVKTDC